MQHVAQGSSTDSNKLERLSGQEVGKSLTPQSSNSSPTKSETDTFSELQPRFMSDSSDSEDEDVSEVNNAFSNMHVKLLVACVNFSTDIICGFRPTH